MCINANARNERALSVTELVGYADDFQRFYDGDAHN